MHMDRRHLVTGSLAGLVAGCAPKVASAAPAARWRAYHERLQGGVTATRAALDPAMAETLLDETNAFRRREGVGALADDPELALAAHAHLSDMQARKYFAHNSPDGFSPGERAGLFCRTFLGLFGENIAFIESSPRLPTARQFFEGWRDSPGHRANMLKADYTHVGHAVLRFGPRVLAAAVFAGEKARLSAPLPLQADGATLNAAIAAAKPSMHSYMLSGPADQEPVQRPYVTAGPGPELGPGAWRLRPMLSRGGGAFDVLWGPIFFIGV
jgi:uncharacterized protein YkwD